MIKYPFTNAGFVGLQNALYAQSDADLRMESAEIRARFTSWMDAHFILHADQILFLERLDPRELDLLSFLTAFAVENRRPVILHAQEPPPDDDDKQGKIIKPKSTMSASNGPNVPFEASGFLEIHIQYI